MVQRTTEKLRDMSKQEENNKLIAEFMGMRRGHQDPNEGRWSKDWFDSNGIRHERLAYDTDWNWLMPVVREISQHEFPVSSHEEATHTTMLHEIGESLMYGNLGGALTEVVNYIKWYNQNKKS